MAGEHGVGTEGTFLVGQRAGSGGQVLPVNVYETTGGLMVVAPMPGIEAEDISITITAGHLAIEGKMRGPRQEGRTYLQHEWHYGPYNRTLPLPFAVRADQANASYGNGVLTVSLLRAAETGPGPITMHHSGQARGQAIGHAGQTPRG